MNIFLCIELQNATRRAIGESEVKPMHNKILTAEDLRETSKYIESLSNAPDNTNGTEGCRERDND